MNISREISNRLLDDGLDVRIGVRGRSMFPVMRTGDKITISPGGKFAIGDIIVCKRGEWMVCHRLVKIFDMNETRYYQTRGDSFFSFDEPVTSDQIMGRVTKIERGDISLVRRILLFNHPAMKFSRINAFVIAISIKLKQAFSAGTSIIHGKLTEVRQLRIDKPNRFLSGYKDPFFVRQPFRS